MARKVKTIDVNKASRKELLTYAGANARYVNSLLDSLENANRTYSKAYQYTQNRLRNKAYMKVGKSGDLRFFSKKAEFEKLSYNELRSLVQSIQGYKKTRSGSVRGQKEIEKDIYDSFRQTAKDYDIELDANFDEKRFKEIVESSTFQNMKNSAQFASSTLFEFLGKYGVNEISTKILEDMTNATIEDLYEKAEAVFKATNGGENEG